MPLTIFNNENGKFRKVRGGSGLDRTNGFWNTVEAGDLDNDGDIDFVIGNHGLNSRFKASSDRPMSILVNDFDAKRTAEQIITMYNGERSYPLSLRHDLTMQLPELKIKYQYYKDYKEQTIEDIFSEEQIRTAAKSNVYTTESSIAWNQGNGRFLLKPLPLEAQFAPVYGLLIKDFDEDGALDILMGGKFYRSKPEVGKYDGSYGLLLQGNGKGDFRALKSSESGFLVKGEIRDLEIIRIEGKDCVLVARNNDYLRVFE